MTSIVLCCTLEPNPGCELDFFTPFHGPWWRIPSVIRRPLTVSARAVVGIFDRSSSCSCSIRGSNSLGGQPFTVVNRKVLTAVVFFVNQS